jgi:hypothetical protein
MRIFARSYRRRRSVMCWMISKPAQPKPLTRFQTPSAACFNPQKAPHRGAFTTGISPFLTIRTLLTTCSTVIFDGTRYSRHPRPAHQQGVGFHHAERFTFAEVGGFAAGRVLCGGITTSWYGLRVFRSFGLKSWLISPPISPDHPLATPPCYAAAAWLSASAQAARWFRR